MTLIPKSVMVERENEMVKKRGRPAGSKNKKVDIKSNGIDLDQVEELLIIRFDEAKKYKELLNINAALNNENQILKAKLEELEKYYKEKEEKAKRFKLAQQQGDIKASVTS